MIQAAPHRAIRRGRYRVAQAIAFTTHRGSPDYAFAHTSSVRQGTLEALRRLPAADQQHVLSVHRLLIEQGANEDVALAGLLHDIGKTLNGHSVRLVDRCLKVMLGKIAPARLARFGQNSPPRWGTGLWIACNHAQLGATIARELGYNERICWLIAHHEDRGACDSDLLLLQAADDSPSTAPSSRPRTAGTEHRR